MANSVDPDEMPHYEPSCLDPALFAKVYVLVCREKGLKKRICVQSLSFKGGPTFRQFVYQGNQLISANGLPWK